MHAYSKVQQHPYTRLLFISNQNDSYHKTRAGFFLLFYLLLYFVIKCIARAKQQRRIRKFYEWHANSDKKNGNKELTKTVQTHRNEKKTPKYTDTLQ